MEKFIENLEEAQKVIQRTDHMIYVTFPLIKDKKILPKILVETKNAITLLLNSILQYEYLYKRIKLYKDPKSNFKTFKEKSAPRYKITPSEIKSIQDLFEVVSKYKQSSFEFVKNDKVVILSNDLKPEIITFEKTKQFLILSKDILEKTKQGILR